MTHTDAGYAIVRVDSDVGDDELRYSVMRVVRSEALAQAEADRLNAVNAGKGCRYFWQYTRVDREN